MMVLAVFTLGSPLAAQAAQQEGLKKPRSLWVNDQSADNQEAESGKDEETSKKTKFNSKKNSRLNPTRNAASPQEKTERGVTVDENFTRDAKAVAGACPGDWESEECLKATSQSALVLISQFGANLEHKGLKAEQDVLKDECAASTAATQEDGIPAYAMKSAYTVCANKIADIAESTGVKPDPSYYQLIIASILCLDKNPQCKIMEQSLQKWE